MSPRLSENIVFVARSLYFVIDPTVSFEDSCNPIAPKSIHIGEEIPEIAEGDSKANAQPGKSLEKVVIFPNPANNELTIDTELGEEGQLVVFSSIGKMIDHRTIPPGANRLRLKTDNWIEGVYFIKVYSRSKELLSEKVMIIH